MATKLKDAATAERAALRLNQGIEVPVKEGEPPAPKEKTTAERLFPDFVTEDGTIQNRPVVKNQPAPATETPTPVPQDQITPATPPTSPTYLKPDELAGKMVKLKVDGIEQDVPASELIKLTQLERHSNAQLMKMAQERAQFERERAEWMARQQQPPTTEKPPKDKPEVKKPAEIEALEARLAQMEQDRMRERELLLPQIQEAGIKRVEAMAKEKLGTDDFRAYFDRVRDMAVSRAQEAQARGALQEAAGYDSANFYFETYKEMKLKDLLSKPASPASVNPNVPALVTETGAPVVVNNSGKPVSIPTFEGSSGVPSRTSPSSDWQTTYNTLLARAKQQPTDDNWMAVMRHKMRSEQ